MSDYLTALKALGDDRISEERARQRRRANAIKASDAADLAARPVLCTCYWHESGSADHAPDCDRERAWQRAYDTRLDELEEGA